MRAHISQALCKRVERLYAPIEAHHTRGLFALALHHGIPMPPGTATRAQRTVLSWPRIAMDLESWERESIKLQDKLIADSYEDREDRSKRNPEPPVTGPDPADRTHAYKPVPFVIPPPAYVGAETTR